MNNRKILILTMSLMMAQPSFAAWGKKCEQADDSSAPVWVKQGYTYKKAGYHAGFGQAVYIKKQSYDEQLLKAENLARADLIKGLKVEVQSELSVETSETTKNKKVNYKQDVVQRISTSSKLELPGLSIKGKWQDKKTCDLFVLVEVPNRIAKLVSQRAIAQSYFEQGKDKRFDIHTRLLVLENAVEIAEKFEFGELANSQPSEHFIEEVNAQLGLLKKQLLSKRNVVYVVNSDSTNIKQTLMESVSSKVDGSFDGGLCSTSTQCMQKAIQTPAIYGTIFSYSFDSVKEKGFYIGNFKLKLSVWDLRSNQLIYNMSEDVAIKPAKVMSRQKHKLTAAEGFRKWKLTNPDALKDIEEYYSVK